MAVGYQSRNHLQGQHHDAVISQRKYRSKQQYLVKWKGYDDPTWEPEDFLLNEAGVPIVPLQLFLRGE